MLMFTCKCYVEYWIKTRNVVRYTDMSQRFCPHGPPSAKVKRLRWKGRVET